MRGPEEHERLMARLSELMLRYEVAISTRDQAIVAASKATHALDAADEALVDIELQLARHLDEMKASSRLRIRLGQGDSP